MSSSLVSCPCIYCKGKLVTRYIRRQQNFTSQKSIVSCTNASSKTVDPPPTAADLEEAPSSSKRLKVIDRGSDCVNETELEEDSYLGSSYI